MTTATPRSAAAISAVALVALYASITVVPRIAEADRSAFAGRLDSGSGLIVVERLALSTITIVTLSAGLLVVFVRAYQRTGRGPAVRIAGAVVGGVVSAELLKHVLPTAVSMSAGRFAASGSFPSGHATIATGFALAVVSTLDAKLARRCWGPLVAWVSLARPAQWQRGGIAPVTPWEGSCSR